MKMFESILPTYDVINNICGFNVLTAY